jgi:hypothetical protein
VGIIFALGITEVFLRARPDLLPGEVSVNPPVRRIDAFRDDTYEIRLSDGDMFYWMRGELAPLPSDQDRVIEQVHFVTDADGFRNALPEQPTYQVIALGDSYTVGLTVPRPWPQVVAETAELGVLNLAESGIGLQAELEMLRQYGMDKDPDWIVMAFFEGNDLLDAAEYVREDPLLIMRAARYFWEGGAQTLSDDEEADDAEPDEAINYRYPIPLTVGDTTVTTVFFSPYMSQLSASRDLIETSENYRLATESLLQTQELSGEVGARFLLVYLPSKSHVYLPHLNDPELQSRVFTATRLVGQDDAGFLRFTEEEGSAELSQQHMDDLAQLLADFCAANGIEFLNLTPVFQEEILTGAELFYTYDSHWNQLGHDVAGQAISDYIMAAES